MRLVLMSFFVALAVYAQGSLAASLPKVCYTTSDNTQFCTTDNLGKVQVFVYSAGWCPSCNDEADELPEVYQQFAGQPVVFANLLGEGWNNGDQPDVQFLQDWKERHHIPFVVAGKYRDFGSAFNPPGYIPFSVIVDKQGNVTKSGFMQASEIGDQVKQLLGNG